MNIHGWRYLLCRTPPGVRGLKFPSRLKNARSEAGRTPPGVRGLKSIWELIGLVPILSHPTRGAWIEIGFAIDSSEIM